jgi:glycosyltransferase involved in cell wall biosynthesis
MNKITFCIPSKNNLRYLKNSIQSIKDNSTIEHEIIVYVDADNDDTEQWLIENQIKYLINETDEPKGIAFGYNRCIEAATSDIVCMFHADMYMAKGFDTAILKYLKPKTVVSATRIEPPLHPQGLEKIVKNFGMYPEDFKQEDFNKYTQRLIESNKNVTTKGIFAPWAIYKNEILSIGMHDESFHSYHEDSDIFNRFILNGCEMIQTWEAYVYHLTCRGGQFQDGIEKVTTDTAFHIMKESAMKNYIRKWGHFVKNDAYQYPIIPHKYNIGYVISNSNSVLLSIVEPWCSTVYITNYNKDFEDYSNRMQQYTKFNLSNRIKSYDDIKQNDVLVEFDGLKLIQDSYNILMQLPEIISESGEIGEFELDIFKIKIHNLSTYEKNLIFI